MREPMQHVPETVFTVSKAVFAMYEAMQYMPETFESMRETVFYLSSAVQYDTVCGRRDRWHKDEHGIR